MATARTITRFGRSYTEFDPDGSGGGPSTWILATPGKGGSSTTGSGAAAGSFLPALPSTIARAGMAVYYKAIGVLDLAVAQDAATTGLTHPYQVVGLAAADTTNGQFVNVITDGQLSLPDWTAVIGAANLEVNKRYFLSDFNPGQLMSYCPTAAGSTVVCIGQAISQQTLDVEINLLVRN